MFHFYQEGLDFWEGGTDIMVIGIEVSFGAP